MEARKFLQRFFWLAFAAFLAASIPHVSYFFRAYEPVDTGMDWWYWTVSTFIAISIDVTVFLLSMTVAGLQRQGKAKGLIVSVWLFIVALAALSWYMNNQYALHFADTAMLAATAVTIPFTGIHTPDINPLIASCFQALAIAYTWISDKIAANETPKTAAQLEQEANELQALTVQRRRIATIKREHNVNGTTAFIDAGAGIIGHIKRRVTKQSSTNGETQPDAIIEQSSATDTGELELLEINSSATVLATESENGMPLNGDENAAKSEDKNNPLDGLGGRSTVSIETAAKIIGCEMKYVKTLRSKGRLKASPRNNELLTVASIKSYVASRKKSNGETHQSNEPIQLRAVK